MTLEQYRELSVPEQDALATEYGITRSGENNQIVNEAELTKITQVVDEKPKEEVKKPVAEEAPKRSNRRRTSKKSKSKSSK